MLVYRRSAVWPRGLFLPLVVLVGAGGPAAGASLDGLIHEQAYEVRRESSSNPELMKNGDAHAIEAGGTLVLADLEGPGIVTRFWNTVGAADPHYGRSLVLRIYYDSAEKPSVAAPLGDFFGLGYGAWAAYQSEAVSVASYGRAKTCYWRMPFKERFRMTVTNDGDQRVDSFYYHLDWQRHGQLPEDTMYFHAQYRQEHPAKPGNYAFLDVEGRGHYVGTVYSAVQMETGWLGEGDEFFYIDGAERPQLRGTGTEEYFNDAWGFRPFDGAYAGVPVYEGVLPGDLVSLYRWHIPDPIPFKTSLRAEIEHKGSIFNEQGDITNFELATFEERYDWLSSVAFWYQAPPAPVKSALPPLDQRLPPYRILEPAQLPHRADPPFQVLPQQGSIAYVPNKAGAEIAFDFALDERGRYRIAGYFLHAVASGVYQPYLDGEKIGEPLDFSIINADVIPRRLDTHDLEAGKHTLRFEGVETRPDEARAGAPQFHAFALARLVLLRLDDMEGYRRVTERLLGK